jgi:hypothetical protein
MKNGAGLLGRLAGGALAAGFLLGTAGVATAAAATSHGSTAPKDKPCPVVQSVLETQLANRAATLTTLTSDVATAVTDMDITTGHAATLNARLSTDTAVIGALVTKVPTDTTCAELIADNHEMYSVRIYEVMQPQTLLVIKADTETATEASLVAQYPTLKTEIAALPNGKTKNQATRLFKLLKLEVNLATIQSSGQAYQVINTTASKWPSNHGIFVRASVHLVAGHYDLVAAANALTALNKLLV